VSWVAMRRRCNSPKAANYKRYGGRGIRVCERWESFELFLEDMGPRPSAQHTIERENNDGHYEPSNCSWATKSEQAASRERAQGERLSFAGKSLRAPEWDTELGFPKRLVRRRLNMGWTLERALTTPHRLAATSNGVGH
jgi:hypothetical protein